MNWWKTRNNGLAIGINAFGYRIASLRRKKGLFQAQYLVEPGNLSQEMDIDFATTSGLPSEILDDITSTISTLPKARTFLILPDRSIRFLSFDLEQLPADPKEAKKIINWQVQKRFSMDISDYRTDIKMQKKPENIRISLVLAPISLIEPLKKRLGAISFDLESAEPCTGAMADLLWLKNKWPQNKTVVLSFDAASLTLAYFSGESMDYFKTIRLIGPDFASSSDNIRKLSTAWAHFARECPVHSQEISLVLLGEYDYFSINSRLIWDLTGKQPTMISPSDLLLPEINDNSGIWLGPVGAIIKGFL